MNFQPNKIYLLALPLSVIYLLPMSTDATPLTLHWTFGFSRNVVNGVRSLCNGGSSEIFYPSANTGVVYDYTKRSQKLLQGHCNQISCVALSDDKEWLITADSGPDSLMVVWNTETGNPAKTIFNANSRGVIGVDVSTDSLFLVVLSALEDNVSSVYSQQISIWELASNTETPVLTEVVPAGTCQTVVRFHPLDARILITNGPSQVFFWSWENDFSCYTPHFSRRDFRQAIGQLTVSVFLPGTTQAITGTSDGAVILWDRPTGISASSSEDSRVLSAERVAVKIMRLCHHAINHLSTVSCYLVVAGNDGAVRLYDFLFRLEAWFEDIDAGPITSVSFTMSGTRNPAESVCHALKSDMILNLSDRSNSGKVRSWGSQVANNSANQVARGIPSVHEFFVGTRSATIVALDLSCFQATEAASRRGTVLIQGMADQVHSLAAHPKIPLLLIACNSGGLYLWDYNTKQLQTIRIFDKTKLQPCCVVFDPTGSFACVGFTSGTVKLLDALTLGEIGASFKITKDSIIALTFSPDSQWLAVADSSHNVALWKFSINNFNEFAFKDLLRDNKACISLSSPSTESSNQSWIYIGRHRSHTRNITGLEFGCRGNDTITLVSTAEDRTLLEYDLATSSVERGLCLQSVPCLLEETAMPTACVWHPILAGDFEDRIITCNSDLKLRQWNANNKQCRCTSLGPTYGGPVVKLASLMKSSEPGDIQPNTKTIHSDFLAYSTSTNVVGLIKLPLDGNPNKTIGILAHPNRVSYVTTSTDGQYIFTCGDTDQVVNLWKVQTSIMNTTQIIGGFGCEPFFNLLDGGKSGNFYGNLVDYFYYAQLRTLGENITASRAISAHVPLCEIPNLMRALGYYPSEIEIMRMISEVKYSKFRTSGELRHDIDISDFVRLYINHRPVNGAACGDRALIGPRFEDLCRLAPGVGQDVDHIKWGQFEKMLGCYGEKISLGEMRSCMISLVGQESPLCSELTCSRLEEHILGLA